MYNKFRKGEPPFAPTASSQMKRAHNEKIHRNMLAGSDTSPASPDRNSGPGNDLLEQRLPPTAHHPRYLHGPVAAEMAGAKGCIACHHPNGKPCTTSRGGAFSCNENEKEMCLLCHGEEAATEHTATEKGCLHCHDPHGSTKSANLLRNTK